MIGPGDTPLERAPSPGGTPGGGPPIKPIVIGGVLLLAFVAGGAWWMWRRPAAVAPAPAAVTATEAPIAAPPAPPAPAVVLPPLHEMDPMMRALLGALSARPELARWLATDGLVQQLAAAIDNAAAGRSSARDFKVVAPTGPFAVSRRGARRTIDPASYKRYAGLVAAVTSIDPPALVKVYRTIQPRLNEAYRNMGHPNGDVDRAVRQALTILLETPVVADPVELTEGAGARWDFADPDLENLAPTQKQLLRMGPDHVKALLQWLQAVQLGLGST